MQQNGVENKLLPANLDLLSLLDFCKGVAIAIIILYHFDSKYMPLGWQGVHIFIVLSGFGLTYSCLKQQAKSLVPINWQQWYLKRAQRILPTYWLTCTITALLLLLKILFTRPDFLSASIKTVIQTFLDLLLLRNFSWTTIFGYNGPLWFVSLIISFYLVFPALYRWITKYQSLKYIVLASALIMFFGFVYRGASLFLLDGLPIGYENVPQVCYQPVVPLNRFSDSGLFLFQRQAPFGFFPARLSEFMLGVTAATILFLRRDRFNLLVVNYGALVVGAVIWHLGNQLTCIGLLGWIFSDFVIALGLMTLILNIAHIFEENFPYIFQKVSWLGAFSFYPFLVHEFLMVRIFPRVGERLDLSLTLRLGESGTILLELLIFTLVIASTTIFSRLLWAFDKSSFSTFVMRSVLSKILRI